MKVLLAGYNLDNETIKELTCDKDKTNITPETLSAAYARISRDKRDIPKLREIARNEVEKARKSNQLIIFGLGHASVAEHAFFNFDIMNLSRFAVEEVQKFRLASFTEKSQRYITLNDDFTIPNEITNCGDEAILIFKDTIEIQNNAYHVLYKNLKQHLFEKYENEIAESKQFKQTVDGWAKEDARYVVALATNSQFGMSVNARTLENMLKQFNASNLSEIRELSSRIYDTVGKLAPSIIKYTTPTDYETQTGPNLKNIFAKHNDISANYNLNEVKLTSSSNDIDLTVISSILSFYNNLDIDTAQAIVAKMNDDEKEEIIKTILKDKKPFDTVQRFFETADFSFEIILSATNFAQFKRHRIATIIPHEYDINLKTTIPHRIKEIGMEELFNTVIEKTELNYKKLQKLLKDKSFIADYILTNAHRRRIFAKMNLRELYHFMGLRLDAHAQWDIRETAEQMRKFIVKKAPLTSMMLCGKSEFKDFYKKNFDKV